MEEIKVSEMLQADSIEKDNAVMIIQDGVNKQASGSIQTATGTSLSLTSVADTCKVTSNSKNMFNGKGSGSAVSVTYELDGSELTLNGTSTNGADIVGATYITTLPAGTYTFSMIKLSGTYNVTQNTGHITLQKTYSGDTILQTLLAELDNGKSTTLTFDSDTTIYLRSYANTGITYSNLVVGIQIEEGGTATSYNPYNTEVIVSNKNLFDGFLNGAYISTTGEWNGSADGKASKKLSVEKGKEYILSGYTSGQTIRIFHWNDGVYISDTTLTTASINKIIMLGNQFAFQSSSSASYNNVVFATSQNISLIPNEEKTAFTCDTQTIVEANGSVTIEYNTQSRLLNNDDTTDIKEYVDNKTDDHLVNVGQTENDEYRVNFLKSNNMFNLDKFFQNAPVTSATKEKTSTGIKLNFTAGVDAIIGYAGQSGATLSEGIRRTTIEVEPSTAYTLSLSTSTRNSSYITYADENYQVINTGYIQMNNVSVYHFTTPSNAKYVVFRFGVRDNSITTYTFADIMLNKGNSALEYEHYIEPSINVDGEEIYSKPAYASYSGTVGGLQTITGTTAVTIANMTVNITTKGRPLFVATSFFAKAANASNSALAKVYVDGVEKVNRLNTIISTSDIPYTGMVLLDNISAGNHTIEIKIAGENANSNITLPTWYTRYLNVWEIN